MKWKRTGIIALLATLVLIAARDMIVHNNLLDFEKGQDQNQPPDWYMTSSHAYTTNTLGTLKSILNSPHLQHFAKDNRLHIQTPDFLVYDQKQVPWHITAKIGDYYENKEAYLRLQNNVVVKQLPGPDSKGTEIHTTLLDYYPSTHLAKTKQPVVVYQEGTIIHSVGMIANLKTSNIDFLSKTQTEYHDTSADKKPANIKPNPRPYKSN